MGKTSEHLTIYLETLGLKPGVSLEDVNTTYYTLIKKFPENPTEEEEAQLQKVKHAYALLRRAYTPEERKPLQALLERRFLAPAVASLAAILLVVLVAMNYDAIRMKMTHYKSGAVLRLKNQDQPFGQVVGFEAMHQFPTGNPSPAYSIRLAGKDETVWISQRLVVSGMVPASSQ
jgi:hypothetical protein